MSEKNAHLTAPNACPVFRFSALFRFLALTVLGAYFLVAALLLVVRFVLFPNMDYWRDSIEHYASSVLQTTVGFEQISAGWSGWNPVIRLEGIRLSDDDGHAVLQVPGAEGTIDWPALLRGQLQFASLQVFGLELLVRRDHDGQLWIMGHSFQLDDLDSSDEVSLDEPAVQWLLTQQQLALQDATIVWQDDSRRTRPLTLKGVSAAFRSQAPSFEFRLQAHSTIDINERFDVRARFEQIEPDLPRNDPRAWDGLLYMAIDDLSPSGWRPWVDISSRLVSGEVSGKWWVSWKNGETDRFAMAISARDFQWSLDAHNFGRAKAGKLLAQGPWSSFERVLQKLPLWDEAEQFATEPVVLQHQPGQAPDIEVSLSLSQARLDLQPEFTDSLQFDDIHVTGAFEDNTEENLQIRIHHGQLRNADMDLQFTGRWQQEAGMPAGKADLHGRFRRASLAAISRYMPSEVDADARQWLKDGLLDGEFYDTDIRLAGNLAEFPFGDVPDQGDFLVTGSYRQAVIDYAPGDDKIAGWPKLTDISGKASLHRVDLRVQADKAVMQPGPGKAIVLQDVQARIADIERQAVLQVRGHSQASAEAYLDLVHHSPLRSLLGGMLDEVQAGGEWLVPVRLSVPLHDVETTLVDGAIQLAGGSLILTPGMPVFDDLQGHLRFSERGLRTPGVQARLLGGVATIHGAIGAKNDQLRISGRMTAESVATYTGIAGMNRFQGSLPYVVDVSMPEPERLVVRASSDLKGLAVDLFAPFGKSAQESLPLAVSWISDRRADSVRLDLSLGDIAQARLLRQPNVKKVAYFNAVSIGIGQPLPDSSDGVHLDIRRPALDLDVWQRQFDTFNSSEEGADSSLDVLMPSMNSVRIQADSLRFLGHTLDQAIVTGQRTTDAQWRMDISSTQTAGTLFFEEQAGGVPGKVKARFQRLALGLQEDNAPDTEESEHAMPELGDELDLPAIDLEVLHLNVYGHDLGHLKLEGKSQHRGHLWRFDTLQISGAGAELTGSGVWWLSGPQRGLSLDAVVAVSDAGTYLDQVGLPDVMQGGRGTVHGQFEWRNLPWGFRRSDLNGHLDLQLDDGRFSSMNSRTARLLELLSWQSLSRLARLDSKPANVFREGFLFDRLSGDLLIDHGVMTTNNYHLSGPAANISLGGDIDLVGGTLNLQAMVVPNLDISGVTLATGLVINPIVGVGAFLTQWLLSKPLSKAMTAHYSVTGSWDDPQLQDLSGPLPSLADNPESVSEDPGTSASPPRATTGRDKELLADEGLNNRVEAKSEEPRPDALDSFGERLQ